jgi:hypothetical protein
MRASTYFSAYERTQIEIRKALFEPVGARKFGQYVRLRKKLRRHLRAILAEYDAEHE